MRNAIAENAPSNKISTKFKGLAAAGALAILLSACGTNPPAEVGSGDAVLTSDAPIEQPTPSTTQAPTNVLGSQKNNDAPIAPAPKPATPAFTIGSCANSAYPAGFEYEVSGIKADDKDGGLVLRTNPNYNQPAIVTILEGEAVFTYEGIDTCATDNKGRTWWLVDSLGFTGWVNASYLDLFDFADDFHGDEGAPDEDGDGLHDFPEDEADVHGDCHIIAHTGDCVVVYRSGADIVSHDGFSDAQASELYLECNYQFDGDACTILALSGQSDLYGNSLGQTPDSFIVEDCNNLSGIEGRLACAEAWNRGLLGE